MKKLTALLLMLVLLGGCLSPVSAKAAQADPQVLQSRYMDETGIYTGTIRYEYNRAGVLISEIWEETGKTVFYDYSANGILKNIYVDVNGENVEMKKFSGDGSGWMLWEAGADGELNLTREHQITFDTAGRKLTVLEQRLYDEEIWGETYTYTYHEAPAPQVGDTVYFGTYEQDGLPENGQEPIEWQILDKQDGKVLLLSTHALDSRQYHKENVNVTWKDASIRSWLNGNFYAIAFYGAPEDQIVETTTEEGGVRDKVFLLSLEDVKNYFPEQGMRCCFATDYAIAQGAYADTVGRGWWLLRTAAERSDYVMSINCDGTIDPDGGRVDSEKGCVRPAMWVWEEAVTGQDAPVKTEVYTDFYITGETRQEHCRKVYEYDREGKLLSVTQDLSDIMEVNYRTDYTYDAQGNVTEIRESYDMFTSLRTKTTVYKNTYDAQNRLIRVEEGFSETIRVTGKPTERQEFRTTYITTYEYNADGRVCLERRTFADGAKDYEKVWQYDAQGNVILAGHNGRVIERNTYGPLSQVLWN